MYWIKYKPIATIDGREQTVAVGLHFAQYNSCLLHVLSFDHMFGPWRGKLLPVIGKSAVLF